MRRLIALLLAALAVAWVWQWRRLLMSVFMRLVAAAQPNPAKRRSIDMRFDTRGTGWTRLTLKVDLSHLLSEVTGRPMEHAGYSHFGGFNLSRGYSDLMNPDSIYYEAWLGAYTVFDNEHVKHFGFDGDGRPVVLDALDILEADQRIVFDAAGCLERFPDGRCVRRLGEWTSREVESGGERWWKVEGEAETWSAYHRGKSPDGNWRHYWPSGEVPPDAPHPVDDFHPMTYVGAIWLRYRPEWQATCAKFYIYPEYTDRNGQTVTRGRQLKAECEGMMEKVMFVKRRSDD
jgi:hypothetical protein